MCYRRFAYKCSIKNVKIQDKGGSFRSHQWSKEERNILLVWSLRFLEFISNQIISNILQILHLPKTRSNVGWWTLPKHVLFHAAVRKTWNTGPWSDVSVTVADNWSFHNHTRWSSIAADAWWPCPCNHFLYIFISNQCFPYIHGDWSHLGIFS
jgi:hypothetical protein